MNLTRRQFLKLSGAAAVSLPFCGFAGTDVVKVPVLMYHDISIRMSQVETTSPRLFAAQMEWLYGMGYRAIPFQELDSLSPEQAKRSVLITFDDGYASFMDYACTLLAEYGFHSTINVIGQHMGGYVSGNDPRLSWDECRCLEQSGLVRIGCHTYGLHTWYGNLARPKAVTVLNEKLGQDLALFQQVFQKEMGRTADTLAWPYGMHDRRSIEIAKQAGMRYIVNSDFGDYVSGSDHFDIPRIFINNDIDLAAFRERMKVS